MPWREMSPMEQRADFVREFESGWFTMTELAAQNGISRKTGYKWVVAYEARGLAGLQSIATATSQSARDRRGGGRCHPRHSSPASALGAEEIAGRRPAPPPRGGVAGAIDDCCPAEAARLGPPRRRRRARRPRRDRRVARSRGRMRCGRSTTKASSSPATDATAIRLRSAMDLVGMCCGAMP